MASVLLLCGFAIFPSTGHLLVRLLDGDLDLRRADIGLLQHHSSEASVLWHSIREGFDVLPSLCAPRHTSPVSTALRLGDSPAGVTLTPVFCWVLRQPRRPGTGGGRSGVHSSAPWAEPELAAAASLSRGPVLPGHPFGSKLSLGSG